MAALSQDAQRFEGMKAHCALARVHPRFVVAMLDAGFQLR